MRLRFREMTLRFNHAETQNYADWLFTEFVGNILAPRVKRLGDFIVGGASTETNGSTVPCGF